MKTIHKFVIDPQDDEPVVVELPINHQILYVDAQFDQVCMWVQLNPALQLQPHLFKIFGTGHWVPDHATYIGSTQISPFVWHLYKV